MLFPFTKPDFSGSGINAFNYARYLNRNGHKSVLLTFNRNLQLRAREVMEDVEIIRIPYFNRTLFFKLLSLPIILLFYIRYILGYKIILIYGAHIIGYQFLIILGRMFRKKIVFRSLLLGADDMDTLFNIKSGLSRRRLVSLFRRIDLYFAINPVFGDSYKKWIGTEQKIFLSSQGVDINSFFPSAIDSSISLRKKYGIDKSIFLIMSVGFLINRKGFIETFDVLNSLDFDFKYIVVGEHEFGPNHFMRKFNLQAQHIKEDGIRLLGDRIHFTGAVSMMRDYYQMADLVLINSRSEGVPNTLLEAMACGKTVLAKSIPGTDYIIDHLETGFLYKDSKKMREWLCKLHDDSDLLTKTGNKALKDIRDKWTIERVWEGLNHRLVENF